MTSLSEISVVRAPASPQGAEVGSPRANWAPLEPSRGRRSSPVALVVLALLCGLAAMALGAVAVVSASRSGDDPAAPATSTTTLDPAGPSVERRVLALLAKPSTQRIPFRGSGGGLVLAVGSGGRAAILSRRSGSWSTDGSTYAWVIRSGRAVRAARLSGTHRAAFLGTPVRTGDGVVVAPDRASALRPGAAGLVAVRG
jgi:hypothetical protein